MAQVVAKEANSITGSASVKGSAGSVLALTLAAGSDAATAIVYDNTAAAGEVEWELAAAANTSESISFGLHPLKCNTGIYVALTGTSPRLSIQYE